MKFKSIFWIFNSVVLIGVVLFLLTTFLLFGADAGLYWGKMWIIAVLFIVLIGVLDFYFVRHWTLFDLLEREEWPALLAWLEDRLYRKGFLRRPYANLLINTALSVPNMDAVKKLEIEVRQRKPQLLSSLGVALGIPILLEQKGESVLNYFAPLADDKKTHRRDWARWCRAWASGAEAAPELMELAAGRDLSVRILSVQLLDHYRDQLNPEQTTAVDSAKNSLRDTLRKESADHLLQRSRQEHLMAVVLSNRVNEARDALL